MSFLRGSHPAATENGAHACHYVIVLHSRENFRNLLGFCREVHEKNELCSLFSQLHLIRIQYNVKDNAYQFRPSYFCFWEQLRKLCSAIKTEKFRRAIRHASKNDRPKRQRYDATRFQPVERHQFVAGKDRQHCILRSQPIHSSPILVFNDLLRGPEAGIALISQSGVPALPAVLSASLNQLVLEKLSSDAAFDLAVRDSNTGFTFFNVEGHRSDYDANAQSLSITGGTAAFQKILPTRLAGHQTPASRWKNFGWRGDATDRGPNNR